MDQSRLEKRYFISYSGKDLDMAKKLKKDLEISGFKIWMDKDDIGPGTTWDDAIERNIRQSAAVLYLVSLTSRSSPHVLRELEFAQIYRKNIIPLWVRGDTVWPNVVAFGLSSTKYIDLRGNSYNKGIHELNQLLKHMSDPDPRFTLYISSLEEDFTLGPLLATSEALSIKKTNIFNFNQKLRVFLCYASENKHHVSDLYKRLVAVGIDTWFDKESLLLGQDWDLEIIRAIHKTHVVIVCLSRHSTNKRGYVQKEIKIALDEADKQPEGAIFIIPIKVEECDLPDRLQRYQTVNFFEEGSFERLMRALKQRADDLGLVE